MIICKNMIFENILKFLDARMTTPTILGWFHILWLILTIFAIIFAVLNRKKLTEKNVRIVLIVWSAVSLLLEIYKQLNFSFNSTTGIWSYQWYAFPFQFCSTPIYIALLAGVLKNGKFRDCLLSYLAIFSLFAGLAVCIYPNNVYTSVIGINIQTMVVHCGMFFVGILLWLSGQIKYNLKTLFRATIIFVIVVAIADALNILVFLTNISGGTEFNMFFISPYFPSQLPILHELFGTGQYFLIVIIYLTVFILAGFLVLLCAIGIKKIMGKSKKNRQLAKFFD